MFSLHLEPFNNVVGQNAHCNSKSIEYYTLQINKIINIMQHTFKSHWHSSLEYVPLCVKFYLN